MTAYSTVSALGHSLAAVAGVPVVLAQAASLGEVLDNLRGVAMGLLGGIATVFLTWAGLLYLTAGGDPGQVERAKAALRNAACGYSLAILAPVLLSVFKQIVGA